MKRISDQYNSNTCYKHVWCCCRCARVVAFLTLDQKMGSMEYGMTNICSFNFSMSVHFSESIGAHHPLTRTHYNAPPPTTTQFHRLLTTRTRSITSHCNGNFYHELCFFQHEMWLHDLTKILKCIYLRNLRVWHMYHCCPEPFTICTAKCACCSKLFHFGYWYTYTIMEVTKW